MDISGHAAPRSPSGSSFPWKWSESCPTDQPCLAGDSPVTGDLSPAHQCQQKLFHQPAPCSKMPAASIVFAWGAHAQGCLRTAPKLIPWWIWGGDLLPTPCPPWAMMLSTGGLQRPFSTPGHEKAPLTPVTAALRSSVLCKQRDRQHLPNSACPKSAAGGTCAPARASGTAACAQGCPRFEARAALPSPSSRVTDFQF